MTNEHNNHESCKCCGSYLASTHSKGCPNDMLSKHVEWRFANGMSMPETNKAALMELAQLVREA